MQVHIIFFFQVLAEYESDNLICSPLSVYVTLFMASYGACGNTKKQLLSALSSPNDKTITEREIQHLLYSLNVNLILFFIDIHEKITTSFLQNMQGAEVKLVNKIFATNKFKLQPKFTKITKEYFGSEVKRVDFINVEKTVRTINNLCANESNNHITDVVEPSKLNVSKFVLNINSKYISLKLKIEYVFLSTIGDIEGAEMILVSAIYFKGKWAEKFKFKWTNPYPFEIDEKTTKDVPMMFKEAKFYWGYIRAVKSRFIKLPYEVRNNLFLWI